jgi:hypothetical protein
LEDEKNNAPSFAPLQCVETSSSSEDVLKVTTGTLFKIGDIFCIDDGQYKFGFDHEGALRYLVNSTEVVWSAPLESSENNGVNNTWVFQNDGNLVVYDGLSLPLWNSGTIQDNSDSAMFMSKEKIWIENRSGCVIWQVPENTQLPECASRPPNNDSALHLSAYYYPWYVTLKYVLSHCILYAVCCIRSLDYPLNQSINHSLTLCEGITAMTGQDMIFKTCHSWVYMAQMMWRLPQPT